MDSELTGGETEINNRTDVLIVGAGPTGLTLAAQLRAFDIPFRLIDRQLNRVHESRALAIQPRTLEVLAGLGVSRLLVERGNSSVQLRMHFGPRVVSVPLFDTGLEDTAYPFLLFLSQAETEAVLGELLAARGTGIERGVELVSFEVGEGDVACVLRDSDGGIEHVRARYLVGCDGAHSTVRHRAGIPFEGGRYARSFALADLEVDGGLERGAVHAFLSARGMAFVFPLGRPATWRLIGMLPESEGADGVRREATTLSLQDMQRITDSFADKSLRLRDPVWLSRFSIHHRHAAHYRAGPVFLAGDAAHVHSPAGGQGMNTGIQDAWNLGWKLALVIRGVADEVLLDSYEAERRPVGREVLRFTDRAFTVATSTSPLFRLVRAHIAPRLAPLALRSRAARTFGFRTISQLNISYRRSPAIDEGRSAPRGGPRAGDRLLDARVARDGQGCSLHEALAAPGYHLLLCGPVAGWDTGRAARLGESYAGLLQVHQLTPEAGRGTLHDVNGEALVRLGVKQAALYLVRPDGHIGYRSGGTDMRGVERHLSRWLPGAGHGTT